MIPATETARNAIKENTDKIKHRHTIDEGFPCRGFHNFSLFISLRFFKIIFISFFLVDGPFPFRVTSDNQNEWPSVLYSVAIFSFLFLLRFRNDWGTSPKKMKIKIISAYQRPSFPLLRRRRWRPDYAIRPSANQLASICNWRDAVGGGMGNWEEGQGIRPSHWSELATLMRSAHAAPHASFHRLPTRKNPVKLGTTRYH